MSTDMQPGMTDGSAPAGYPVYSDYVEAQVGREDEKKKSIESRGVTVITTSGTLATLLLGLTALSTRAKATFELSHAAARPLQFALLAFTVAAAAAIATNLPLRYSEADVDGLRNVLDTRWEDTESEASKAVASNRLNVLASATTLNSIKARCLVSQWRPRRPRSAS